MSDPLVATWLGRTAYLEGWRLQEAVASRVRRGGPDRLLMLEHDPVYTIGRRGQADHLTASHEELRASGVTAYRVDRGGDITYHGPGQLVCYPVISLGERPDLVAYVRALEGAVIETLAAYGVVARRIEHKTGVWVDLTEERAAKIAAIGVRVSRGVTTHGLALNVSTDLAAFDRMIPCGFVHEVTSLERLGVRTEVEAVAVRLALSVSSGLGRSLRWEEALAPVRESELPPGSPVLAAEDLLAVAS